MNKIFLVILTAMMLTSCSEDFLNNPPPTGLSDDKLVDLSSMKSLVNGAYYITRGWIVHGTIYSTAMVRDATVRNNPNYPQFFDHQPDNPYSVYNYRALGLLNTIAVSNLQDMEGGDEEKHAILGDMHFLRALIYFELNGYYALPSTGYTMPLLLEPLGVNDRVSCARTEEVMNTIEADIEQARTYFMDVSGIADYYAATALAARIYFYHKKYSLAYQRAHEVISSGKFSIEAEVTAPFVPGSNSRERIFSFQFDPADGTGTYPASLLFDVYQADQSKGSFSLYSEGMLGQLMQADSTDARWAFYEEGASLTYINGKYSTDQMDHIYIRLAEMHLTRAEANIMVNNSVVQQDVDDINILRNRANPSSALTSVPSVGDALNLLYEDRVRELAIEVGDHFRNVKRLERGIVRIPGEGIGMKPYSEYSDMLAFSFPQNEIKIHGLTRNP